MSAPAAAPLPKFDDTLGTMLIGVLFATFLQGMLTLQLYYYFDQFNNDHWSVKMLVLSVWSLDLIHLILVMHGLYHYTVTNWGNFAALPVSTWQLDSHVAVTGIVSFLCQGYFLKRLYVLSDKNWFIVIWPLLGAAASCALDLAITIKIIETPLFSEFARTTPEAIGTFSLTALTDAVIALLLCFYLARQKTHFKQTQTLIRKVIKYTITTGLFTSVVAIISLITFVLKENTFVFFSTYFSLGSLYTNSLLASLNTRQSLRSAAREADTAISLPQYRSRTGKSNPDPIQVMVSTTTMNDEYVAADKASSDRV